MKERVFPLRSVLLMAALTAGFVMGCKGDPAPTTDAKSEPPKTADTGATGMTTAAAKPSTPPATTGGAGSQFASSPAGAATTAAAKAPDAPTLAAPGAGQEAPAVSEGNSAPPSVAEWQAAPSANTVGANSAPRDCELKVVREWLKVNCTGNIKEITNMEGFGVKNADYFELVTPGKVADFVVRMKKGKFLKMRIIREGQSASLFMNWPTQSAKPSIIALQIFNP